MILGFSERKYASTQLKVRNKLGTNNGRRKFYKHTSDFSLFQIVISEKNTIFAIESII